MVLNSIGLWLPCLFLLSSFMPLSVGSMEKQPKFLESKQTEKIVVWAFGGLFGAGAIYAGWSMFVVFYELLRTIDFMPIFEFRCKGYSKVSEILVRSTDWEGRVQCPSCDSSQLENTVFPAAIPHMASGSFELPLFSGMPSNCCSCDLDN